jgi:hypothetical protein
MRSLGIGLLTVALASCGLAEPEVSTKTSAVLDGLNYGGGSLLTQVKLVVVYWYDGTFDPWVLGNMEPFYEAMLKSAYMDLLWEYNVPWYTNFGRGSVYNDQAYWIAPKNRSTALSQADIESELQSQIQDGWLPSPDANTLYALHFPAGIHITANNGSTACGPNAYDWCGYHDHFKSSIGDIRYFVMPDFSPGSGCDIRCGRNTRLGNYTSTASHEVLEAMTDPDPFSGWSGGTSGEIGDYCGKTASDAKIMDTYGTVYSVQRMWSNKAAAKGLNPCVAGVPRNRDILFRDDSTGDVSLWITHNDDPTLLTPVTVRSSLDRAWWIRGTGDFDGDGIGDVLLSNILTAEVQIWFMDGVGGIKSVASPQLGLSTAWRIYAGGDFNGDGNSDILALNVHTGDVKIWLMSGGLILGTTTPAFGVDGLWQIQGFGDFDGDGTSDILWRNTSTGDVGIWIMKGGLISQWQYPQYGLDSAWQIQGVGDFNGDGTSDILLANPGTGDVIIWMMNGGAIAWKAHPGYGVDQAWVIRGVGDFNGDGMSDVLWQNTSTGQIGVWQMKWGSIVNFLYPGWAPSSVSVQGTVLAPN